MASAGARAFDHVVIIMFENEYRNYVLRNPYMAELAAQGIDMATYFGVMHPSNTNYVASIAGETCNITVDPMFNTLLPEPGQPYPTAALPASMLPQPLTPLTVVDRLRDKGLSWRAYMEAYQPVEFPPQFTEVMSGSPPALDLEETSKHTILDYPPYVNMHNAFVRFQSILGDQSQWERIVPLYDFFTDCLNGTLPEYCWISPGAWGDGHWVWGSYDDPTERAPLLVDQLAKWLKTFFGVLNFPGPHSRIPPNTLVVVTFDESEFTKDYQTVENLANDYDGPNQIYTVLLGDRIAPGQRVEAEAYNHYSLLKTVERNFGLEPLGKNDTESNWLRFLWDEHFRWTAPQETPLGGASFVTAAGLDDMLVTASGNAGGVQSRTFCDDGWSDPLPVPAPDGTTAAAMAACGGELVLLCQTASGLSALTADATGTWSAAQTVVAQGVGSFSVTSFTDYGDGTEKVMLLYALNGSLTSQTYAAGTWSAAVSVGQQTDGAVVAAVLGTSLFAIYKVPGTNGMNAVSYNTATFNVVTSSNSSATTQYLWSPSAFPVAHFAHSPARTDTGDLPMPVTDVYEGVAPFAAATLDGVLHLAHGAASGSGVMTERFSTSGIFTPKNAVNDTQGATGSNGWGTLAEAGWSPQLPLPGVATGAAMAMARFGGHVALLSQEAAGGAVTMSMGRYERT